MQGSTSQRETCKVAQARGRHPRQHEGEEGTQGRQRERKAPKGGRGSGRHPREAEGEGGTLGNRRDREARTCTHTHRLI